MDEILFHSSVKFIIDEGHDKTDLTTLNVIGIYIVICVIYILYVCRV